MIRPQSLHSVLKHGDVHIWLAPIASVNRSLGAFDFESSLSLEELQRLGSFIHPEPKEEYLLTRWLIRTVLSFYYPQQQPNSWTFSANELGKPRVTNAVASGVEFSISHTKGMITCAIAHEQAVGIDVESITDKGCFLEIASGHFSQAEIDDLKKWLPSTQSKRFLQYWTLKEAFLKAKGVGMAIGLDQFWFDIPSVPMKIDDLPLQEKIMIKFTDSFIEHPKNWLFRSFELENGYQAALAVNSINPQISIRCEDMTRKFSYSQRGGCFPAEE